jgi:predicted O-methyltransferase YrrM
MKYFFYVDKPDKYSIEYVKDDLNLDTKLYNEYNKQIYEIKELSKKDNYVGKIVKDYKFLFDIIMIMFQKYNIDPSKIACLRSDMNDDKLFFYISNIKNEIICDNVEKCNKKYTFLLQDKISNSMYNKIHNLDYCDREDFIYNYKLTYISYFYDILEIGGSVLIKIFNYCNPNTINIIYLLATIFEKVVLFNGTYIYCNGFLYTNSGITKEDILNLKDKSFTIKNKKDITQLIEYINENLQEIVDNNKNLLNGKIDLFIDNRITKYFLQLEEAKIYPNDKILKKFKINIIKDYRRIFIDSQVKKIHSGIKSPEMESIDNVISSNHLTKCLEIGMAFGTSAITILSNEKCNLISIDPFQSTQWESNGVKLVKEFGFSDRHELIEKKSYIALPELLTDHESSFDFIFIDGWHTFDYTLLDFFYSNLLLKIGGFIMIDDALHNGVSSCMRYLNKNYLFYKKMDSIKTIGVYKKLKEDNREWNFHGNF